MLPRIGHVRGAATLAEQRLPLEPPRGAHFVGRAHGAALRTSETGHQTLLAPCRLHQQVDNVERHRLPLVPRKQGVEVGQRQRAPRV